MLNSFSINSNSRSNSFCKKSFNSFTAPIPFDKKSFNSNSAPIRELERELNWIIPAPEELTPAL